MSPHPPSRYATKAVLSALALFCLCSLSSNSVLAADAPAGSVKSVAGEALVTRAGAAAPLKIGDRVYERDVLTTGKGATLGLVLRDNSTLSLGPGSRLVVERFLFEPEKGALAQVLKLSRGSMAAVSGEIVKLNPEVAKIETPVYSVGIRGTHVLLNVEPGLETAEDKAQVTGAAK
ncbi:FecR family protein [Humidesulfovibrio mexicanus]|uniref:FecR family protein n=1 Tax=Humidesulfovibrio mexicanus TaxID=147047 RepID=A0A238ZAC3_9BACT|nr:FecR family protein [Humidesulfovibrio mexicanus]SNR80476.1 FecR family protein [Humidesulfovibrio mexicanus]